MNAERTVKTLLAAGLLVLLAGCRDEGSNTFKFVGELPEGFSYHGTAWYRPEFDQKCDAGGFRGVAINRYWWKEESFPETTIEIRKVVKGCPMVVRHLELRIRAKYGESFYDDARDRANVGIYETLDRKYHREFSGSNEDIFYGVCQWMFRTIDKDRMLMRSVSCRKDNERGEKGLGHPFAAYTVDQLPGKVVRMNIRVDRKHKPSMGDTWIEFPNGWKRCAGKGTEDDGGFCDGNYSDFSKFKVSRDKYCTIYPGCEE